MNVSILISIASPRLTEEQEDVFRRIMQWVYLNERNGRIMIEAYGQRGAIQTALNELSRIGKSPVSLGAWQEDGARVQGHALKLAEWLELAPDNIDNTDPDNPVYTRPVAWREIHRFQGWAPKEIV